MFVLIVETSTEKSTIIFAEKNTPLRFKQLSGGALLSKNLGKEIKELLGSDVPDIIAAGEGPGSFTGMRVGAAIAKGLSLGWKIPLIGFSSLLAFGPPPVLFDARSGGFYAHFGEIAEKISLEDLRQKAPFCAHTPHLELIEKRVDFPIELIEKWPDPNWLASLVWDRVLENKKRPLELNYLSCP